MSKLLKRIFLTVWLIVHLFANMTKPSVEEQLAALGRKRTLLQRNMQRTSNRAVADTAMDAASAECHLALLKSHFRPLCQVQQQIEEIDFYSNKI